MAIEYRELEIRFPNGERETITGENIVSESMVITKSICDGNLKLGGCIATQFDLQLVGIKPDEIQGCKIQAVFLEYSDEHFDVLYPSDDLIPSETLIPDGHLSYNCTERIIFTGYVDSAKRQKQREFVNITAYDELYKIGNTNVSAWFFSFAQYSGNSYIMTLIESLFGSQIGYDEDYRQNGLKWLIRWQRSGDNNNFTRPLALGATLVDKIYHGEITANDILRSANELMGLFGYMTEDGKYNTLSLVGQPTVDIHYWTDLDFEEYVTEQIDIVGFTYNDNDKYVFGRASSTKCTYYSDDNVLTNCSTGNGDKIKTMISNIANAGGLSGENYRYRPFTLKTMEELLALDHANIGLGSKVNISTGYSDVPYVIGFVMQEKISGIQALQYEFSAEGDRILSGYDNINEVM